MIRVFLCVLTAFLPVVASPYPLLKFHGTEETLERIKEIISHEEKGAYLRFGDGDVNLALGQNDLLQTARYKLMREMQEAFCLNGPTILKTLPLYCRELGGGMR